MRPAALPIRLRAVFTAMFICLLWLATLLSSGQALAQGAPPLFAAPPRSGALAVELRPTEVVQAGQTSLVTFGVPFPRGALLVGELAQVKLSVGGAEVPAWVEMLTPWRHPTDPALDGSSVRVLRVQIEHTFSAGFPSSHALTLSWNQGARTLSRGAWADPRSAWHLVTDATTRTGGKTFGASHRVFEPDVYAVLPKSWLAASGLKNPMLPFAAGVQETRRDPATMPARLPGHEEADHAQVNFFYTILNDDEPNTVVSDSNTNHFADALAYEPWLYDRAMVMFVGYLRGGQFRMLREAVRNADYYRQQLWTPADCGNRACVGSLKLKNTDPLASWHDAKYSYNESLALAHWLTGDAAPVPYIEYVPRQYAESARVNTAFWTERHMGLKLMAETVAYEFTGKAEYRERMRQTLADFRLDQTQPYGGVVDGGIWHSIGAHEGDPSAAPITSPWMSALIVDAALRAVVIGETAWAQPLVEGLAAHVCGRGSYRSSAALRAASGGATLRIPHYLATLDGNGWPSELDPFSNVEHAHEAATIAAWGAYFRARALDTMAATALASCADEFYVTFDHLITSWTRPGTPNYDAYRVNPSRKYTWWYKNSSGFGWAMAAASGALPPLSVALTAPLEGAQFNAPANFTLAANVAGTEAAQRVEFWRDGIKLAEDASSPYTAAVSHLAAGVYRFEARAVGTAGQTVASPAVTVRVNPPPAGLTVALTAPVAGAQYTAPATVSLAANAGPGGSVVRVEFWNNGVKAAEDTVAPYAASIANLAIGSYRLEARAVGNDGSVVVSPAATISVVAAPPPAAAVYLSSPTAGAGYLLGTPVPLEARIEGRVTVTRLEVLAGTSVVLTRTAAPWSGSWTPQAVGSHTVRARAHLSDGRMLESAGVTFSVSSAPPPGQTVQLRQGLNGYTGAVDLGVSNQYLPYNGGRGVVSNDARSGAFRISGSSGYEVRSFLRFGGLEAMRGRKLLKAELVLAFEWGAGGYTLSGQYLARPWNAGSTAFGWTLRDTATPWAAPGSGGTDWLAGRSFVLSGFVPKAADVRRVLLDTAVVQGWIDQPATNHGIVLVPTQADKVSWMISSEAAHAAYRPMLELTFE